MPRVVWKGAVAFGLVHIPVRLFTAVHDKSIRFHLMSADGSCRLRRKLVCPESGEEYAFDQTGRGFEVAPGQYVLLKDEEIAALQPEGGHTIEIEDFVDLGEIDPVYFDSTYYVGPGEGGGRAYHLMVEALERSQRVGLGRFVMRTRQYLAAVRPRDGTLVLSTMHWPDEVASLEEVVAKPTEKVDERQVKLAIELVDRLTRPFEPERYRDTHREQVAALIERKAEGEQIPVAAEPEPAAPVADLMEALRQSLHQVGERKTEKA